MWLRVANLALFTIPTISLIEYDDQSVILRFSHVKKCRFHFYTLAFL